jgi:hypothetical protein
MVSPVWRQSNIGERNFRFNRMILSHFSERIILGVLAVCFTCIREGGSMQKALASGISTWPDDNPQLIGSRCGDCAATAFPAQQRCPRCSRAAMTELLLPRRGDARGLDHARLPARTSLCRSDG